MSYLPEIISDLALILISAGLVTLIFKRLGQPLVLGYIVAGFMAGPHMPYTPSVTDTSSIQSWADIGVIFLMFTLGLDFSFKKILKMGPKPIFAACMIVFCMMSVGNVAGFLFGWNSMDRLFLGGMLAMSSTTIIYKAFDDLALRSQKFSSEVLSVLVLEDILGILLMVVLSAMAVSRTFEGAQLLGSLLQLSFFLIIWFIVGVYVVPTFLRKSGKWINDETLLIVAIGLCFMLVVMASKAGYSSAFGAFMMGSILAETTEAENVERVVKPLKNLFGAIFFVSVGMLVNPQILMQYWWPILALTLAIIVGQAIFGSISFLLSGQSLRVSMQCGFSLTQIGEFAFIIASLGTALNVTSQFLYPVVVAVSIVTTFLTPYMIKAAVPSYNAICRLIPERIHGKTSSNKNLLQDAQPPRPWRTLIGSLLSGVSIYLALSVAVVLIAFGFLLPFCRTIFGHWPGNTICAVLTISLVSPFLRAIVMRKNHSEPWKILRKKGRGNQCGLLLTIGIRYALATFVVAYVINFLSPLPSPWRLPAHFSISAFLVGAMVASRRIKYLSILMERNFVKNLRSRDTKKQLEANGKRPAYAGRLLSHDIHLSQLQIPANSNWCGKNLRELQFGENCGVLIAAIIRGPYRINIPDGGATLYPGDRIEAIGDDDSLQHFSERIGSEITPLTENTSKYQLMLHRLNIARNSPMIGGTLKNSQLKEKYHCMAVGFEADDGTIDTADSSRVINCNDTLWIVGEEQSLKRVEAAVKQDA